MLIIIYLLLLIVILKKIDLIYVFVGMDEMIQDEVKQLMVHLNKIAKVRLPEKTYDHRLFKEIICRKM